MNGADGRDWQGRFEKCLWRCTRAGRPAIPAADFLAATSADYRRWVAPSEAVGDCLSIAAMDAASGMVVRLRRTGAAGELSVRFLSPAERPLDEFLPWLAHLGLRVRDQVQLVLSLASRPFFLRLFFVAPLRGDAAVLFGRRRALVQVLRAVADGSLPDDPLNGLIASTELAAGDVDVLRAYRNYYRQLRGPVWGERIEQALLNNPAVARILFAYFEARFDPAHGTLEPAVREETRIEPLRRSLSDALAEVQGVEADRLLRVLFNLIDATLRTNHYRRSGRADAPLALKIYGLGVIDMPSPRPAYEIYVHATEFEGIHLRGARVARGGIRWSERENDLRAEILDLQQTQMLKNALIVPQGAKGGFVLHRPPVAAEAREAVGRRVYRRFIEALLDVTDNAPGGQPPSAPQALAYDEPDSYLVVAADKGTAGFSDLANEAAAEAGFWLGDAFASGGSRGYNHKRFGITARGAWECLRRHFRELGRDLDREPITVVGVGSMDGDVFGNGMLLSQNLRLLGAFSADHIFLDPNPETSSAFRERKRLFELPGSTWDHYDRTVLGAGGGVFRRSAKQIPLPPACREWLGVRDAVVDGEELVRLLLMAPVDLLWFGGIGTFVKSSDESPEQVGDRANEVVRVEASALRAKVVGEGANLAFTQRGRVEFALRGGRINMDAIDNSGGVDLSDHEVNLKILLGQVAAEGTRAPGWREELLFAVADEVCTAVIGHNADQSLALSLDEARCRRRPEPFFELIERFEEAGLIDRRRAALPTRAEVLARPQRGLTRPELTQLLAPAKLALKSALSAAGACLDLGCFEAEFRAYFPQRIRQSFAAQLHRHPLAADITASQLCNRIIDRAGAGFLSWTGEATPRVLNRAATLYVLFDRVLDGERLTRAIRSTASLPADHEVQLLLAVEDALQMLCRWGLASAAPASANAATVAAWRAHWEDFCAAIGAVRTDAERAVADSAAVASVGAGLAREVVDALALLEYVDDFPHVVAVHRAAACGVPEALRRYRRVAAWFGWPEIKRCVARMALEEGQEAAVLAIQDRLLGAFARLGTASAVAGQRDPGRFLDALCDRGLLSRVARIKQRLPSVSSHRFLELLVVLMSEAGAAADDGTVTPR